MVLALDAQTSVPLKSNGNDEEDSDDKTLSPLGLVVLSCSYLLLFSALFLLHVTLALLHHLFTQTMIPHMNEPNSHIFCS